MAEPPTKSSKKSSTKKPTKKKERTSASVPINDRVKNVEKVLDTDKATSSTGAENLLARDEVKNRAKGYVCCLFELRESIYGHF